jgi:hypothetical protein
MVSLASMLSFMAQPALQFFIDTSMLSATKSQYPLSAVGRALRTFGSGACCGSAAREPRNCSLSAGRRDM